MNFKHALTRAYCKNPCQVLPNALWKTLAMLNEHDTLIGLEKESVTHLEIWGDQELFLYWDANRSATIEIQPRRWDEINFALIHQDYVSQIPPGLFNSWKFFRLVHKFNTPQIHQPEPSFEFSNVDMLTEIPQVVRLIDACYEDISPSVETIKGWLAHPTFDRDLWIWVINKNSESPIGLGIAEFDETISEGSLEWIQVLPEFRGRGIGCALVQELIRRLNSKAVFATVAGQVDNKNRPEALYRRCGFEGNDIWYLLRPRSRIT
jgi:GNAT superfamily N-acetyltransferase